MEINIEDLKKKSCTNYLLESGAKVDSRKSSKRYTFFYSPFRNERTASLAINNNRNTWFDYGIGFGGDVIRLVEINENLSFKEAIHKLAGVDLPMVEIKKKEKSSIEILDVTDIKSQHLISYLHKRKINVDLAKEYISEVTFLLKDKRQNAIGFKNDKGGFELRNDRNLKIGTSPKWITTIEGNKSVYNIFEGFVDFLSLISYYNTHPKATTIVLNSVSMIAKVDIKEGKKRFYGDNDKAGDDCFSKIDGAVDMRGLYKGYKDINEWLTQQ